MNVTLYDSAGGIIDTAHDYVDPYPVAPSGKATFKVWLDDPSHRGSQVKSVANAE